MPIIKKNTRIIDVSLTGIVAAHHSNEFREIPSRLHTHLWRISPSETLYAIEHRRTGSACRKQPAIVTEVHTPCIPREATMAHNIRMGYDLVAYILSEVDALCLEASLWLSSSPLQHISRSWRFGNVHLQHLSLHNCRSVGISTAGKSVYPFSVRSPAR